MPSHRLNSGLPEAFLGTLLALVFALLAGPQLPAVADGHQTGRPGVGARTISPVHSFTWAKNRKLDSDKDGLPNWAEVKLTHTDPRLADSDGDGLSDRTEIRRTRTNPRRADSDGDGASDGFEISAGTNPLNPVSFPVLTPGAPTPAPPVVPPPADTTAPNTMIGSGPAATTTSTSASFAFSSTESGSTFRCKLDSASYSSCTSPKFYTGLALGSHTFAVRATDGSGNTDATPATQSWTIDSSAPPPDTIAPDTTIGSAPPATTTSTSASFDFSSTESGSTFECKLGSASYSSCSSPKSYSGLPSGGNTFRVRATDPAGNVDPTPAKGTWTIETTPPPPDTIAPDTTIGSGPAATTTSTSASFALTSTESGSTFECKLDSASYSSCTSPKSYSGLALGSHTFSVRASDGSGNTDTTPATQSWTIDSSAPPTDTTPPNTTISAAPPSTTTSTSASFSFGSTESGSTFECKLGSASYSACTSPKSYAGLALGSQTFSVRASDGSGNTDATPATQSWTIESPPPPEGTPTSAFYIRDGATSSTCTDWSNACDALPSTLKRGATYYIAGGSYAGRTFNTAASGTERITIKGATAANHGTDAGWSASYSVKAGDGGSQAVWTSGLTFTTSYWVFDGIAGPSWSRTTGDYGFKINPTAYAVRVYNNSSAIANVAISHIAATAPAGDIEKFFLSTANETKSVNDVTLSHSLLNGWSNAVWATSAGLLMNNWLIEHNVILNGFSSATNHGEDINNNYGHLDNLTVRYNIFEGRRGSTGCIVVLNGPAGPYYIYGNVFKDMEGGDGIITGVHYTLSGAIYNNTFDNVDNGYGNGAWIGHDVSAAVSDNIVFDSVAAIGGSFTGTKDYNAYFATTSTPSEAHGYSSSANPFVDADAANYKLTSSAASAMPAGSVFASPFDKDIEGIVRGADGKWDRGAFEVP